MEARVLELPPSPETDPESFYHPHEEDSVPVSGIHDSVVRYLETALAAYLPDHWVGGDLCCYWIPRNNRVYLAPDVFVAERVAPAPLPNSFRRWEHGPLRLVIEVGSRTSLRRDVGPKLDRYAEGLLPDEYLYYDADHGVLNLHRRSGDDYELVQPDADGRLWSEAIGSSFGMQPDGFLRAFGRDGAPIPSTAEAMEQAEAARRDAEAARQDADVARQDAEAARQQAADAAARTELETRLRTEAERQRAELAERLARLEAELARQRGEP